jgi:aryl-alcohol dehydrogenase-like predicted oxidoreductase
MEKRVLGKTDLEISTFGYGGMELQYLDEKCAYAILNQALDSGINYVDTSPEYPMSEYYIGKSIAHRRNEFVLATKTGDNMSGEGPSYIFDAKTITANVEESLRLMKTDHLDLLQLHGVIPDYLPGGEGGEAMETMRKMKKEGKALHLGLTICNKNSALYGYPANYGYNSILRFAKWADIESVQLVYGCMTRLSENVIQKAHDDYHTGVVARGALKSYSPIYAERYEVARLGELCEKDETKTGFFIRFVLSHPALASAVIGTRSISHLAENIKAAEKGPLPADVYAEAKRRLNFVGVIPGPVDMKLDWQ